MTTAEGSAAAPQAARWRLVAVGRDLPGRDDRIQGVAALVILLVFGKGVDTDAVFAAYGLYGVIVHVSDAAPDRRRALLEGPSPWEAFDRFLGPASGSCSSPLPRS